MNVAYVNPFVQGAQSVLSTLCGETPALGQVHVKNPPYTTEAIAISVAIFGHFSGEAVFSMEGTAARFIASKMMMGMPVPELDAMAQSALSELGNMISGNVATLFAGKGIIVDIKPPNFRQNPSPADFPLAAQTPKIVCVPLKFAEGHVFSVDVMIP
ncbi:MAG: chemotaxis protein CheX [Defluviitaleaceae bacterium]|nr:chemotaxis protein CheX [Defluviitaleaceae bacterium]MCL2239379.1 chemotaxis protein CheX [Defluviitaleaceae bacterium]